MEAVNLPKGLIRFASEAEISDKRPFRWTVRMKAYSAVLGVLVIALFALVLTRSDVESTVLRTPGLLFQKREDGRISNLYTYKLVNKTNKDVPVHFKLLNAAGEVQPVGSFPTVERASMRAGELFIILETGELEGYNTLLTVGVYSGDKLLEKVKTSFVGPMKRSK